MAVSSKRSHENFKFHALKCIAIVTLIRRTLRSKLEVYNMFRLQLHDELRGRLVKGESKDIAQP